MAGYPAAIAESEMYISQLLFTIALDTSHKPVAGGHHTTHHIQFAMGIEQWHLKTHLLVNNQQNFHRRNEGNVLFNDALNTFYFTLIWCQTYGKGPF